MAFRLNRLNRGKPVPAQLARIVKKEFQNAVDQLTHTGAGAAEAIHEARTSVKKIRAVLRLVEKSLGRCVPAENRELRAIAHELAPLRDLDATAEILKSLRDRYSDILTRSAFIVVEEGLQTKKRSAVRHLHPSRLLQHVAQDLRLCAATAACLLRRVTGFREVQDGITRGYRRARKAMHKVESTPEDVFFHAWRRRVKDHWYHVRLFEGLSATARARTRKLRQLETWLGDDHNLVLLRSTVLEAPARFGGDRATALVLGCSARYQAVLRGKALKLGARMFGRKPKAFRESVAAWHKATR